MQGAWELALWKSDCGDLVRFDRMGFYLSQRCTQQLLEAVHSSRSILLTLCCSDLCFTRPSLFHALEQPSVNDSILLAMVMSLVRLIEHEKGQKHLLSFQYGFILKVERPFPLYTASIYVTAEPSSIVLVAILGRNMTPLSGQHVAT